MPGKTLRVVLDLAGRPPWWQMALDEAVLEAVAAGESPPTLRVYVFSPTSVTVGLFQRVRDAVDLEEARRLGVPVVRRFTGGGAVLHDEDGEVTYSIAAPATGPLRGVEESYRVLCTAVARALQRLGAPAQYVAPNDMAVGGRKVSGNAQARRRGALLQHGTILYDADKALMERLLRAPREKLESHGARSIADRVANLSEVLGKRVEPLEIARALVEAFSEALGLEPVEAWYTEGELRRAWVLKKRYMSREWLLRR